MNDRAALLRAILDNPEDDLLRLVFADWLQEHGEEPFAHFIRREIAVRRAGDDVLAVERIRDEYRGLAPEGDKFPMPGLPEWANSQERERGFLASVLARPSEWEDQRDGLMDREPIRSLKLVVSENENPWECLRHPNNSRLRTLQIFRHGTPNADIADIAAIPALANLERLDLSHQELTAEGFATVARSPHLRRLRELDLSHCPGGSEGIAFIASAEWPELRKLNLKAVGSEAVGVELLTASTGFPQLRSLDLGGLWGGRIGDRGARTLAATPLLGQLEELGLTYAGLTDEGIEALAVSPHTSNLCRLNLSRNEFSARGLRALFSSPHLADLHSLDISANDFNRERRPPGPPTWGMLRKLRHLKLNYCKGTSSELAGLLALPDVPPLERLELSDESLGVTAWKAIRDGLVVRASLRTLKIAGGTAAPDALKQIAAIQWLALEMLRLESCKLGRKSLRLLAENVGLKGLIYLSLKNNETLHDHMAAFVDADLPALEILDLRGIRTPSNILDQILSSPTMPCLKTLYVDSQKSLDRLSKKHPGRLVRI